MTIDEIKKKLKDAEIDTRKTGNRIKNILQYLKKNPIVAKKELNVLKRDIQIQKSVIESLEMDYPTMLEGLIDQIRDHEISFNRQFIDKMKMEGFNIKKTENGYSIDDYMILLNKKAGTMIITYSDEQIRSGVPYQVGGAHRCFIEAKKSIEKHFSDKQYLRFMNVLYETHLELSHDNRNPKGKIGVFSIYNKLIFNIQNQAFKENPSCENTTPYNRAFFSYDIMYCMKSKLTTKNGFSIRTGTATYDISGDKRKCLYLPDGHGSGRWCESIFFEKV